MVLTGLPPLRVLVFTRLWLGRSIIIPVAFIAVPEAIRYLQANSSRSDLQNEQTKLTDSVFLIEIVLAYC